MSLIIICGSVFLTCISDQILFWWQVVAMDMMTAAGDVVHISREENPELLPAAVLSLGALGIILNVTLQCEPAFNLHLKQHPAALKDVSGASGHVRAFNLQQKQQVSCLLER